MKGNASPGLPDGRGELAVHLTEEIMSEELQALIRQARRELRRASGVPLTPEEQAEDRRLVQFREMRTFMHSKMRPPLLGPLRVRAVWTDKSVAGQMTVDGHVFELRKDGSAYVLFAIEGGDVELARIKGSDPNFSDRVLVAIADALPRFATTGLP